MFRFLTDVNDSSQVGFSISLLACTTTSSELLKCEQVSVETQCGAPADFLIYVFVVFAGLAAFLAGKRSSELLECEHKCVEKQFGDFADFHFFFVWCLQAWHLELQLNMLRSQQRSTLLICVSSPTRSDAKEVRSLRWLAS